HLRETALLPRAQLDRAARRGELDRVRQEIAEHLADLAWIREYLEAGLDAALAHVEPYARRIRTDPLDGVADPVICRARAQVEIQPASFDARQLEQLADQLRQTVDLDMHPPQEVRAAIRIVQGAVFERFDERLQRRDRRLELMRDVGHEVAPHG